MIEFPLTVVDIGRIRFGHSVMWEVVASLQVLRDPRRHHRYAAWVARTLPRIRGADLELLTSLAGSGPGVSALLAPAPRRLSGTLADELARLAATWGDDPRREVPRLVQQIRRYWSIALAPEWSRVAQVVAADVAFRTERLSRSGIAEVLDGLHPDVVFHDDRLTVSAGGDRLIHADGRGVVLVPCVFGAPAVRYSGGDRSQPVLAYPARGHAAVDAEVVDELPDALGSLVGRTRAVLLDALGAPASPTQLARDLDMSAAAISQHLQVLRRSALVDGRRRGREVLYHRTDAGTVLLNATRAA